MKWLLLVSTLAIVNCRPQSEKQESAGQTVEVEKQELLEIHPQPKQLSQEEIQRSVEERTRQIYEKIAEVNKKQGLTPRKRRPDYFHFPFSYSRSQPQKQAEDNGFRFSSNPFTNPILDYLERQGSNSEATNSIRVNLGQNQINPDGDDDAVPPGQYIKRKVVHQQTILTPMLPNNYQAYPSVPPHYLNSIPNIPVRGTNFVHNQESNTENTEQEMQGLKNRTLTNLEKETVENIKNIVLNSQNPLQQITPIHLNPYGQHLPPMYDLNNNYPSPYLAPAGGNYASGYNYQLYGPFVIPNLQQVSPRQQLQWPWAQFFPIVIKDPMQQMMNAITSMIEYGPTASGCKHIRTSNEDHDDKNSRSGKKLNTNSLLYEIKNEDTAPEITIRNNNEHLQENVTTLDIEDLLIKASTADPSKPIFGFKSWKTESRNGKVSGEVSAKINIFNITKDTHRVSSKLAKAPEEDNSQKRFTLLPRPISVSKPVVQNQQFPPVRGKPTYDEENEDMLQDEKAEDISLVSHDGNKKLFSKDNTGSGIFIHRLKVRKGGVAIAGPGGIATAGSGGTAIVGPGGVAYTHPDSLAIAGSGTKVVAVDPTINLADLISGNKTKKDGDMSRIGKVVAIGPVVYYNRG